MTPIGHFCISYAIGKTHPSICLWAIILGGILPDIDFFLLPFPFFNHIHRRLTHNVFWVSLSALFIGSIKPQKRQYSQLNRSLSLFFGGLIHLFLDSCFDANPSNGIGIALFWPFKERYFSPFNFLSPDFTSLGWKLPVEAIKSSVLDMIWELPFLLIALIIWLQERKSISE